MQTTRVFTTDLRAHELYQLWSLQNKAAEEAIPDYKRMDALLAFANHTYNKFQNASKTYCQLTTKLWTLKIDLFTTNGEPIAPLETPLTNHYITHKPEQLYDKGDTPCPS